MMQAEYAVSDEGHWALASDCYCHFTSPIRRYPDLTVHRALAQCEGWDGPAPNTARAEPRGRRGRWKGTAADVLRETAAHCSRTERNAEAAERELTKVKVLTLLEKHIGEEFSGVVSAVEQYGLFVEIHKFMIEGLVHLTSLLDDAYQFDARSYTLVGRARQRKIRIGDTIRVVIAAVDIPRRELDLAPAPGTVHAEAARQPSRPSKAAKPKKGYHDNRHPRRRHRH
jgi:ribonuclease R